LIGIFLFIIMEEYKSYHNILIISKKSPREEVI